MKATSLLLFIYSFVAVFAIKALAQNTNAEPLDAILPDIEKKYGVTFSYADASIRNIQVEIHYDLLSLEECIAQLALQTNLNFKTLDSRYIAIQRESTTGIVSGIIRDHHTQKHIEGAFIYSGKSYAISDGKGYFSLEVKSNKDSLIVVRHTAYKPLHLPREKWTNNPAYYELIPDIQLIDEVVINYIAKGLDKLRDGSILMNVRNLEVLPGLAEPDVLHTVQVLPGIQSINETVADINTRGGTNDQSMIMWDGVKMYQTGHFFGLISAFNSHLIHKTRIVKNGSNAYYNEGISGIIDMKQQDYLANEFEVNAGINMVSGDIIFKIPVSPKLSLLAGARHSINDLFLTPTYKNYYKRAFDDTEVILNQQVLDEPAEEFHDFSFYDISGKLIYEVSEEDKIQLSVLHIHNKINYEESAATPELFERKISHLEQSSLLSNLEYSRKWNENHLTRVSAYFSGYLLDGANVSHSDDEQHLQENEVLDWGGKLESKNKISPSFLLSGGYEFKEIGIRNLDNIRSPGYFRDAKDVLRIHAVYAEAEHKNLVENLYLRGGLRTSYISKFDQFFFEPSLVLNYKLNNRFSIEAMAERKQQHTTQLIDFQTDFLGIEKRRWVLSNEQSIPLLESRQLSLGLQYNHNNLLVSLEGYQKEVSGIISPSQGFQNQFESVYAVGEYESYGMELLLNKRFKQANIWSNYTLAKNDYYFPDFTPSVFPNNFDIRHSLSFGGTLSFNRLEVSGGFNYRTGKPYTKPAQSKLDVNYDIVYEDPNSSRLDDYARVDISAKYKFATKRVKGELGFSIWNVLNRDNIINIYYQDVGNNEIEQITQHALNITPNVNLRLKF